VTVIGTRPVPAETRGTSLDAPVVANRFSSQTQLPDAPEIEVPYLGQVLKLARENATGALLVRHRRTR
jgi:hypothetical protein